MEREQARYGALPEREELKRAQGELQYLKVLEEEIRQGEGALREAEEAYEQARREALDDRFNGMSGEEAVSRAAADGPSGGRHWSAPVGRSAAFPSF